MKIPVGVKSQTVHTYYKVLVNSQPDPWSGDQHRRKKFATAPYADFDYSKYLPKKGTKKPGPWLPVIPSRQLVLCSNGYHLTKHPDKWFDSEKSRIYLCEAVGKRRTHDSFDEPGRKDVFQSFRFVRMLTRTEHAELGCEL